MLLGECGGQHMMTPLFAVAPCSGCWGLNLSSTSGATLAKPFGESSLSPLICTTEKLALWDTARPQETVHVKGWHTGSARKHGPLLYLDQSVRGEGSGR